ncbi:ATP-binding protein [Streptomyces sp. MZ04]|uniref:sensor histidine kinase n=1 Tax=Streptomyces sp. MZ04 TaxID=2559236 RepID=UPI00107EA4C5|nr:ATP-binding protein [Streptomyces sp. MZ04]TGB15530.1 sensor histidine kinase [Streptomyces sp. MZ04]
MLQPFLDRLIAQIAVGRDQLGHTLAQTEQGHRPVKPESPVTVSVGDPMAYVEQCLRRLLSEAQIAVVRAAAVGHGPAESAQGQAEMMVAISARLRAKLSRQIEVLTLIESGIEDPVLLKPVFKTDHLSMLIKRDVENLAILGGSRPPASLQPLPVQTALRQAVSEVEDFARVKVRAPQDWALHGFVGPEAVHLLAELVENATVFSPPHTEVNVRAVRVTGGLLIEVEDSGLSMSAGQLAEHNALLAAPHTVDVGARLRQGQLGLLVASRLAAPHHIHVRLHPGESGGHRAAVLFPEALLTSPHAQPDVQPTTSSLPRRLRAKPVPVPGGQPASPPGTGSTCTERPAAGLRPLPRRTKAPRGSVPAVPAGGHPVVVRPAPGLMADFTDGADGARNGVPASGGES